MSIREKVLDFLNRYGEKGFFVLKSAVEIAEDPNIDHKLGDFDYKKLYFKLQRNGLNYAPQNLLRILEKEYGLIERSYTSSNQKWWRFVDLEEVRNAIYEFMGHFDIDDPKITVIRVKYRSLDPQNILSTLKKFSLKEKLSNVDREVFRKFVFENLDIIAKLLREMMEYEDVFINEIEVLKEILRYADIVSQKIIPLHGSRLEKTYRANLEIIKDTYEEREKDI
ncbi:MAG: hypothetical protein QXY53_03490 [Desulfurococcaceae archaeon]